MAENSAIEWTDSTFNPWIGCTKVGPGCDHCYAETRDRRKLLGPMSHWGPGAPRHRTSTSTWRQPLAWQAEAAAFFAAHGRRRRVFCASMADVFDNEVNPAWRANLFELIEATPDLDWLLLTKRVGNATRMLWEHCGLAAFPQNVWLGATVVTQAEADRDIPKLLLTSARVRFLSMEPLLGPVDLQHVKTSAPDQGRWQIIDALSGREGYGSKLGYTSTGTRRAPLDWIIAGGESGPSARPMHPDWARSIRDQCEVSGVPFLFKQWGEWVPDTAGDRCIDLAGRNMPNLEPGGRNGDGTIRIRRAGKKLAGRVLDGRTHDGFPS